ncbi:hypothetical protein PISMIDRAFT_674063 [Pisolithus microcarpus 441]|uniref:Uncharacterized protein n=1 Tax=Pisolithus microcarpus 441 TaxID=765257 RepID=A0A0D0A1K0_9AGAM|nr:hypothetical protein PISMIDRAFT_674063 [Pisolithus microcarpus 441]
MECASRHTGGISQLRGLRRHDVVGTGWMIHGRSFRSTNTLWGKIDSGLYVKDLRKLENVPSTFSRGHLQPPTLAST